MRSWATQHLSHADPLAHIVSVYSLSDAMRQTKPQQPGIRLNSYSKCIAMEKKWKLETSAVEPISICRHFPSGPISNARIYIFRNCCDSVFSDIVLCGCAEKSKNKIYFPKLSHQKLLESSIQTENDNSAEMSDFHRRCIYQTVFLDLIFSMVALNLNDFMNNMTFESYHAFFRLWPNNELANSIGLDAIELPE